jgi:hypothetical protein
MTTEIKSTKYYKAKAENHFQLKGKSYASYNFAVAKAAALQESLGIPFRFIIGSSPDGRYVIVCTGGHQGAIGALCQSGVTVVA